MSFRGRTPRETSVNESPIDVEELIWGNPSKYLVGNWDGYLIHRVCYDGRVMDLFKIVKANKDLNALSEDQNTALHYACAHNKVLIVRELLKHADVNTHFPNVYGDTPLHVASKKGHADIVKAMIRHGRCNMYENNRKRETCVILASNNATKKVFHQQITAEQKFLDAVEGKDYRLVRKLCSNPGVNVNCIRVRDVLEKKNVKHNALDIVFSTKKLSELDDHEDLVRLLVHRGCNVPKSILSYDCKFTKLLNDGYLRQKRYHFLREILQTEKVYNEDLEITIRLFYDPLKEKVEGEKTNRVLRTIKSREMQKQLILFWEVLRAIQRGAKENLTLMEEKFRKLTIKMRSLEGAEREERSEELEEAEMEFMSCLEAIKLEPYVKFCNLQTRVEDWIKNKKDFQEVYKFYREQEQLIPLPRIRDGGFVSMLSKIRNRLFKFRGFLECVMKYTDASESDGYTEILRSGLKHVMDGLDRINKDAGDIENEKQMSSIQEIFEEKYHIKMDIEDNIKWFDHSLDGCEEDDAKKKKKGAVKTRKYICHEINFKGINMETMDVYDCDIYVFSDSIFFGSKKGGGFHFYWYKDRKVVWSLREDHYRLQIYKLREEGGKIVLDYMVPCGNSFQWFKEMKDFFSKHHSSFYWNHIFLHRAFDQDKAIEEFRKLRKAENEMAVQARMMNLYKKMRDHHKERWDIYTNRVVEKKRAIEKLKREQKKRTRSMGGPGPGLGGMGLKIGKGKLGGAGGVIKKVDLKVKFAFDSPRTVAENMKKKERGPHQRRWTIQGNPMKKKVKFAPMKPMFSLPRSGVPGPSEPVEEEEEQEDLEAVVFGKEGFSSPVNDGDVSESLFQTSGHAKKLFGLPHRPVVKPEKKKMKKKKVRVVKERKSRPNQIIFSIDETKKKPEKIERRTPPIPKKTEEVVASPPKKATDSIFDMKPNEVKKKKEESLSSEEEEETEEVTEEATEDDDEEESTEEKEEESESEEEEEEGEESSEEEEEEGEEESSSSEEEESEEEEESD